MTDNLIFEDAFNLLCGEKLGSGIHREVFSCRIRNDLVVKVEQAHEWRYFSNVHESKFWSDHEHFEAVAKWLAPVRYLSPDGRILLQDRVRPINPEDKLPDTLPAWLTDIKRDNFGFYNGRLVCVDYAITLTSINRKFRRVLWD